VRTPPVPEAGARTAAPRVIVAENLEALAEEASSLLLSRLAEAVDARGGARIVLAGGSTPRRTYSLLASGLSALGIPARVLSWFFGDERWVTRDDPQSNEGMARETLLGPLDAPEDSIHSWNAGSGDPVECARRYGETLLASLHGEKPDVVLLGVGPDGHTASLFPGATAFLPEGRTVPIQRRLCAGSAAAAVQRGDTPGWRLTLCPDILGSARHVVFLAAGADKADAVRRAVNNDPGTPAAWIRGTTTTYIVTRDAAGTGDTGFGFEVRRA
jgi:6-phosphogluconolactonase